MSFQVILIAVAHAVPVFMVHKIWRNKTLDWVVSAIMAVIAFSVGDISYVLFDLAAIGIALWSCLADTIPVNSMKETQSLRQTPASSPGVTQGSSFLTWIVILGVVCSAIFVMLKDSPEAYQSQQTTAVSPPIIQAPLAQPQAIPRAVNPTPNTPNSTSSTPQKSYEGGEYSWNLKDIETRHPELNPDHLKFRSDLLREAANRLETFKKRGYSPTEALKLAVASMERENAFIALARPSTVLQQTATHELSVGEETTIGMACGHYQMNGDVERYQLCIREQTNRASRGSALPTMNHLTMGEQVTINMACGDHQMIGNIEAYQSCIRTTVLKASR
jgi:hypothetical protein